MRHAACGGKRSGVGERERTNYLEAAKKRQTYIR